MYLVLLFDPIYLVYWLVLHVQVFDAYAQFEESMISAKMEESQETGLDQTGEIDLELRLARFEVLMDRRPLLLNRLV